jgi:hypothetical protein
MVKFNRTEVIAYIRDVLAITDGQMTITVSGILNDGTQFSGSVVLNVISKGNK